MTRTILPAPMNPEIKQQWVQALRSGKYQQAIGVLKEHGDDRFCCLGVLCNVLGALWEDGSISDDPVLDEEPANDDQFLSQVVLDRVGLGSDQEEELAAMNDVGRPFAEIADWIEENL